VLKNLIKDKTSSTITILQHWLTHQMGMCIILKQEWANILRTILL